MNWTQLICILFANNFSIAFILARQFKSETIKMIPKYAHGNWMERIFVEVYVLKLSFSRLIIWLTDRAREVSFLSYSINLLYQERVNWQTKLSSYDFAWNFSVMVIFLTTFKVKNYFWTSGRNLPVVFVIPHYKLSE